MAQELAHRAYLLGEANSVEVVPELFSLLQSQHSVVRKMAASAFGKIAGLEFDKPKVIELLVSIATTDDYPQTRQYALKALVGYVQHILHDDYWSAIERLAVDQSVKPYVNNAARLVLAKRGKVSMSGQNQGAKSEIVSTNNGAGISFRDIIANPNRYVKGEQLLAWTFKTTSPMLIKGGAGSGKTIVAMLRALYAGKVSKESLFGRGRVAFLTFDKLLNDEVKIALAGTGVSVMTVDSWIYKYLRMMGDPLDKILPGKPDVNKKFEECLSKARQAVFSGVEETRSITKKNRRFFIDEFEWLKCRGIETLDDYQASDRAGRGSGARLSSEDRKSIWKMKSLYEQYCSDLGLEDFSDRTVRAWKMVQTQGIPDNLTFDHVVVDEAQDFTYLKLRLTSAMTTGDTPEEKGITLVADVAQEIYQSGFSWKDADIAIRGRTKVFKRNYRNTKQIAQAAYSMMAHESDQDEMTTMDLPIAEGPKPELWIAEYKGRGCQLGDQMRERIILALKRQAGTRVIAAYSASQVKTLAEYFMSKGFAVNLREPIGHGENPVSGGGENGVLHLRTLHHMKGLQFDHVYLWGLGTMPKSTNEDRSEESVLRKLVSVGMTRACRTLTICELGESSRFVDEIDPDLIERSVF